MGLREYTQEERDEFVLRPEKLTKLRKETEVVMSQVFTTIHRNSEANTQAQTYIHQKMVEKLGDEELARKLIPNSTFGCKRIIVSTRVPANKPAANTRIGASSADHPGALLLAARARLPRVL